MTASADDHGSRRWLDPLAPVAGVVALATFALHGVNGVLSRDLAVYAYAGQQFADGSPPYQGILNRAGPLAHMIPGVGVAAARVGGFDDLLGMRLLYLLISAVCVALVYLLGRDLLRSRLGGLASAAAFLSFAGFIEYASGGPREKTPMLLFLVAALWAASRRRWFTAGLLLSLATLVLQLAFPAGIAALLVGLLAEPPGRRLRGFAAIVLGGLVPVALGAAYLALVGAAGDALAGFLTINARYTTGSAFLENAGRNWRIVRTGYGFSTWFIVVGVVAILVVSLLTLVVQSRRRDEGGPMLVAIGVTTVAALAWTARDFDGWPDLFVLLPFAALGVGTLVRELGAHLPRRASVAVALAWTVAAVTVAVTFSVTERDHTLVRQRASVDRVLSVLPAGSDIVVISAPQPLVLSGKTNSTRYAMLTSGLDDYVDDTWPGGMVGFTDSILRQRPALIAVAPPRSAWAATTFGSEYVRVQRAPGWVWFADRALGPDVLSALRRR